MKNRFKVRTEISTLATGTISGVGIYTKMIIESLDKDTSVEQDLSYFNFLNRQPAPDIRITQSKITSNKFVPLKIYSKLQSLNIAWPFDIFKPRVDLTIFTNFATWPTAKSKFTATTIHDLTYIYHPETVESKNLTHLRRVVPRTIKNTDIILTVSKTVKKEIVKEFGIDEDKIVVTYNTVDQRFYNKATSKEINYVKSKYKIPTDKYIYFIGNFEPRKNLVNLIRAYRLLPQSIKSEYSLVLAGGKGWSSKEAEKELQKSNLNNENVVHIGYINQKDSPTLYQGSNLFVMPSLYEGFGIPILEAMASNVPVACSDIAVLQETAGNAAVFFDPADDNSIASAIIKTLEDRDLRKKLINYGLENINRFSWDENLNRILSKLQELSREQ